MRRLLTVTIVVLLLAALTPSAWACGFLVAENGAIRLSRFTALAAWEDGVEHYVTSFEFQGPAASFGAIVPLPAVPTTVEEGGNWTLQRLQREVDPPPRVLRARGEETSESAAEGAEVLATYEVEALDIAILSGGGQDVLDWTQANGFDLGVADDAAEMLDFYAERSPVFAAVRYDLDRADELDRSEGDSTPVHFEMPLDAPWVPLRILTFDKPDSEIVEADVFVLTPQRPRLLPAAGLDVAVSEQADPELLDDLRNDVASGWVPREAWLTYVDVSTPAGELDYDLAVGVGGAAPSVEAAYGASPPADLVRADAVSPPDRAAPDPEVIDERALLSRVPGATAGVVGLVAAVLMAVVLRAAVRRRRAAGSTP
jgi:hypothetical protein